MYSYEDRLRAVRLYIKLGKRIGLTIRQLGYPTKNALKTWYREYEQRHDLAAGYCDDQVAGLSMQVAAVRLASGASSAKHARRQSIAGAAARNQAVCCDCLVHAPGQRAGSGRRGRRVAGLAVQVEESIARPRRTRIYEAQARRPCKL